MSMMDSLCYDAMLSRPKGIIKMLKRIKLLNVQRPIGHLRSFPTLLIRLFLSTPNQFSKISQGKGFIYGRLHLLKAVGKYSRRNQHKISFYSALITNWSKTDSENRFYNP